MTAPGTTNPRPLLLVASCVAVAVSMLDTTIVTVALPDLQRDSGLDLSDLQWLVNSYLVVFTALTLAGGVLADRLGRRSLLVTGLAIFAAGSLLTAVGHPSGGWDELRIGRVVQGLGAALSEPATLAVLRSAYGERRARARALGTWAASAALAIALGPVIGGLLVAAGGWRAVFFANLPLAAIAIVLALIGVPRSHPQTERPRFDIAGIVLGAVALAGLSFGLLEQQDRGFTDPTVVAALAVAAVAALAIVPVERRAVAPALPLDIAFGRGSRAANAGALAASFAIFAVFFLVTLTLEILGGASALATAGAFAPMVVLLAGGALVSGRLAPRLGPHRVMGVGLTISAVGLGLLETVLGPHPSVGGAIGPLLVLGLGLGVVLAPAAGIVLDAVAPERAGVAAATVNLARQLGGLIAVAVLGAVTVGQLSANLDTQLAKVGLNSSFHDQVLAAITHPGRGGIVTGGPAPAAGDFIARAKLAATKAAEAAFSSGVRLALAITIGVVVLAAVLAFLSSRLDATPEYEGGPGVMWRQLVAALRWVPTGASV